MRAGISLPRGGRAEGRRSLCHRLLLQVRRVAREAAVQDAELLPAYADGKFYETYIAELSARIARLGAPSDEQRATSLIEAYGKVSEALFRDMLYRKYERLNEARQEERPPFTMQNYRTHFRTFVERYPVVLSTTHSLCASIGAGHLLDYVIIDESSQVDILTAAVCCACCRNIIIIGDSRQLPHIVEEQLRAKAEELRDKHRVPDAYDYVRQNILSSFKRVFGERLPVTLLREHYRCHPLIIDFCNRKYYRNELLIMTEPKGGYPFTVLTTTASKTYSHNGRIYNQRQIDATCDWIERQGSVPEYAAMRSRPPMRNANRRPNGSPNGSSEEFSPRRIGFPPSASTDTTGCTIWSDGTSSCPTRSASSSAAARIFDFLLYNRMDNTPILGIEVDGVLHHRFDEVQVARDRRKNGILVKIGLPLLRLSTDGSSEKERIVGALEQAMQPGVSAEQRQIRKAIRDRQDTVRKQR